MTHTYSKALFHLIWSTKKRRAFIDESLKYILYEYIKGIIKEKKCIPIMINGMPDHVHILTQIPLTVTIPSLVQQIKVSSAKWISREFPNQKEFSWQEGLGAYSVGYSNVEAVKAYLSNQEHHHKNMTFEEEYLNFLKMQNISYDERFIFG